ncbi:MAG: ExbD/TolR family protein [Verrucomicrobiia bacterium]|jgi:biopolymer transport protein ExbD
MRYSRNAKIFRGQLDAAPFAGVFFSLLIFVMLNQMMVHTPGVKIDLAQADNLPGIGEPSIAVAMGADGQFYFRNQTVSPAKLKEELRAEVFRAKQQGRDLSVIALIDGSLPSRALVMLAEISREAGVKQLLQATRPLGGTAPSTVPQP